MGHDIKIIREIKAGCIQQCRCGVIHIHYHDFSVRMKKTDFFVFSSMMKEAALNIMKNDRDSVMAEEIDNGDEKDIIIN